MLRNILIGIFSAILVVAIGTAAYNITTARADQAPAAVEASAGNQGPAETGMHDPAAEIAAIPAADLDETEKAALLYMYEEEKLARDVYQALYATWNITTFSNISASEQMHMDAVKALLDRYELTAPALDAGEFANPDLQSLYTQLVARGEGSASEALKVGGAIEELDILDLQERLAETDNADIQQVFTALMNGSYHHLQAFTSALLSQTGEVYQPQYMTPEAYQQALESAATGMGDMNGHGSMNGQGGMDGAGNHGAAAQQSGSGLSVETITLQGVVVSYEYGTLTVTQEDGTPLTVSLGNPAYVSEIGFAPQAGDVLSLTGYYNADGAFSVVSITTADGSTYTFRTETSGPPAWAGGHGRGNH